MPERKPSRFRVSGKFLIFLPSVLLLLFPAKDIGRLALRTPHFAVPDTVVAGEPISITDTSGEIAGIRFNGRALLHLANDKSHEPIYIGAADVRQSHRLGLDIVYSGPHLKLAQKLKQIFKPHLHHPDVPYFTKSIRVTEPEMPSEETNVRAPASQGDEKPLNAKLRSILLKKDGEPKVSCWKEPELKFQAPPPAMYARRRPLKRHPTYTVTSAAPGVVVYIGEGKPQEKTVVVYHGGGVFSRYKNLKDFRVRKGDKVKPGEELGVVTFATKKEADGAEAEWEVLWGQTPVTPPSFLALSSQLCGST